MYKRKLLELGIPANMSGFEYLNYAIDVYKPGQRAMCLYASVADKYGTLARRVERNMRHAIEKTGRDITVSAFIAECKILWGGTQDDHQ